MRPKRYREVLRVGAEPLIVWDSEPDGSPRFSIATPGWRFRFRVTGELPTLVECGEGSLLSATPLDDNGIALVPSDELPDLEHGFVTIADFTIADLRAIRHKTGRTGWISPMAWLRWHWTNFRLRHLRWVDHGQ